MSPLIKRLEEATEGSRELDEELFVLVHSRKRKISTFEQYQPSETLPQYTRSLDAALTLVPEGMSGHVDIGKMSGIYQCGLWNGKFVQDVKENYGESKATPALALVIAALKAREQCLDG